MKQVDVAGGPDEKGEPVDAASAGPDGVLEETRHTTVWAPLFPYSRVHPLHLGLTTDGDWIAATPLEDADDPPPRGTIYAKSNSASAFYLVPMLEWTPSVIRDRCQLAALDINVEPE